VNEFGLGSGWGWGHRNTHELVEDIVLYFKEHYNILLLCNQQMHNI